MPDTDQTLPPGELFDSLTPPQRGALLALMEPINFRADDSVVEEGKQTPGLWILVQGRCEVVKATPDGSRHVLAELFPGAVFGEMTFFRPAPHSATVRCATDVSTLKLSTDSYSRLKQTCPDAAGEIAVATAVILSRRLRRMDDWITRLLNSDTAERRAEWSEFRAKLYNNWDF